MIELNGIRLDKTSAVPLYEQLRKALLEAITSGKLSAGTKLPTEEELCAQFGISRPVARQAYNMLIEEGFVERMRGRGTFVRSPDTRGRFLNKQLSFAAEMGVLNLEHRTEVLRAEWVSYTPELFARLKLEREDRCYHLVRMRYVSGKPFVLVENYVPESVFPGIDAYDFAQRSLYDVFETVYHERIIKSRRVLMAQTANVEFANLFGVHRGSPVLYVENVAWTKMTVRSTSAKSIWTALPRNLNLKLSTNKPGLCARSFQRSVIYYSRCSCDRAWRLCRRYGCQCKNAGRQ